jgi:hypothetical protein
MSLTVDGLLLFGQTLPKKSLQPLVGLAGVEVAQRRWWLRVVDVPARGVGAELESTMKMKSENEIENDHFCKSEERDRFF